MHGSSFPVAKWHMNHHLHNQLYQNPVMVMVMDIVICKARRMEQWPKPGPAELTLYSFLNVKQSRGQENIQISISVCYQISLLTKLALKIDTLSSRLPETSLLI